MRGLFARFWHDLRASKHYVIASVLVFATGWIAGVTGLGGMDRIGRETGESIGMIAEWLAGKENPQLWFFAFIFLNNAIKSVLFVFAGALFGVFPIYVLLANGAVLGYVLSANANESVSAFELFVKGILPHGIIELPALMLSCAYGIRLGFLIAKSLFYSMIPSRRGEVSALWMQFMTVLAPLFAVLVTAMFLASVIESTITPILLQ